MYKAYSDVILYGERALGEDGLRKKYSKTCNRYLPRSGGSDSTLNCKSPATIQKID